MSEEYPPKELGIGEWAQWLMDHPESKGRKHLGDVFEGLFDQASKKTERQDPEPREDTP